MTRSGKTGHMETFAQIELLVPLECTHWIVGRGIVKPLFCIRRILWYKLLKVKELYVVLTHWWMASNYHCHGNTSIMWAFTILHNQWQSQWKKVGALPGEMQICMGIAPTPEGSKKMEVFHRAITQWVSWVILCITTQNNKFLYSRFSQIWSHMTNILANTSTDRQTDSSTNLSFLVGFVQLIMISRMTGSTFSRACGGTPWENRNKERRKSEWVRDKDRDR